MIFDLIKEPIVKIAIIAYCVLFLIGIVIKIVLKISNDRTERLRRW